MPFVAPCRELSPLAPFRWIKLGIADLLRAPQQSLVYGVIVSLVLGVLTAFVGLIAIVPIIGHAAWHGYLETIDANEFPRHSVGITSIPRDEPTNYDDSSSTQ